MERKTEQSFELSLEIKCIARAVLRHFSIVLALAVSVACFSFVGAGLLYRPTYTSSTTFVISSASGGSSAYGNLQSAREMVPTFQTLVNSDLMCKRVAADLGEEKLPGTISVHAVEETNLVTISATADRPDTAFQILKSLMKVYPEVGDKALGEIIMEVFDQAEYPTRPDRAFAGWKIIETAFVASALAAMVMLGAAFWMKDTVRTPEQAKSKLDAKLFGIIYHEKNYRDLRDLLRHKRKSLLISDPAVSFLYEENMKKISTKLLYKLRAEHAQVALVTSTLEGEGKSTLAMNLAQDLCHRGKKVLLVEGDLRTPGLAAVLGVDEEQLPDWSQCLRRGTEPAQAMCCPGHYTFRVLLNGTEDPQAADLLEKAPLDRWIEEWKKEFDVILVDAPSVRRRSDTELWVRRADLAVLVVRQNMAEAKYINDSIDLIGEYGTDLVGFVYNDAIKERDFSTAGYGYGQYGSYGHYGHYGSYGRYGAYGKYGSYGKYGGYGKYDRGERSEERQDMPNGSGER